MESNEIRSFILMYYVTLNYTYSKTSMPECILPKHNVVFKFE